MLVTDTGMVSACLSVTRLSPVQETAALSTELRNCLAWSSENCRFLINPL
jgi:hypothetical protein